MFRVEGLLEFVQSFGWSNLGLRLRLHEGVSDNRATSFWGPYNKDPTI